VSSVLIETPGTLRPLLRLTTPVLIEQMLHLLVGFVDWWLAGNYLPGEAYLAAMTLIVYVLWFLSNLFSFVAHGSTALVARYVGAGDALTANRVMNQSITSGLVWTALLMAGTLPFASQLVAMMGLSGRAAEAATQYFVIELIVLPAIMMERVGIACLRGAGDTVSGLVTMLIVNAINMGLSYALLIGWGSLPALGWTGIALGTAIGHCCGALILLALLVGGRAGFHLRLSQMRPDREMIRRLLRIGVPGGIDMLLVTICQLVFLRIILRLGDVPAAAHGLAIQIEALAYMPGGAFQIAAATVAGQYLGARDYYRARRSVLMACVAASVLMVGAGVIFYVAAEPLTEFFLEDQNEAVVPLASEVLRVIAFAMLPLAIMMVLAGALRGAGDTRWPLVFTIIGLLVVRLPLAVWFAYGEIAIPLTAVVLNGMGYGVVGAWYGAVIDICVRCGLMIARFQHGGWQRVQV
jgi:putative MATE family efflux protein